MRAILIACLLLAASVAQANPVAHSGGDWVMLTDKPCPKAIASKVQPQYQAIVHEAKAMIAGQAFTACWASDGIVAHLLYEDGDSGQVPLGDFKDSPEV